MGANVNQYRKHFKEGEILIKEGEIGNTLIFPEKGILDIYIQDKKINSINAEDAQNFIGEVGAILGTPRTATVIAVTECIALCVPQIDLDSVFKNAPSLGIKLVRSLCEKLVQTSSNLKDVNQLQAKNRSILDSGNTETSLRNYMKGILKLIESALQDPSGEKGKYLLDFFLKTNPWGIQYSDDNQVFLKPKI